MSLKVVLGKEKEPTGVFIALEDWNNLAPSVDHNSELYQLMAGLTFKSVFEMSFEEMEARAKPITERAKKIAWDNDLPISYKNEVCTEEGMIIREYKGGEKELVKVSLLDGTSKKVRGL
jgi:hypothetical protein